MGVLKKRLKVAKEVAGGGVEDDTYAPPPGSIVNVNYFKGEGTFKPNAIVKVVWKYQHATEAEIILWGTKGVSKLDIEEIIPATDTDGIRVLALVCDNGGATALILTGRVDLVIKN